MRASLAMTTARLGLALSIVLATAALTVTAGRAYNNNTNPPCRFPYSGGSSYLMLPWRYTATDTPTGAYDTAFTTARTVWSTSSTPVVFTPGGPSTTHYMTAYYAPAGNGAGFMAQPTCSGGFRTITTVVLNKTILDAKSSTFKTSTAMHELGHWIGLGHSTVAPAVMDPNRAKETIYYPQVDDLCGVNHLYSSTSWPPTCGY